MMKMRGRLLMVLFFLVVIVFLQGSSAARAQTTEVRLAVDATEAPRKIFHARLTIPASPGPLTLLYPKWIPGEHGPTGPITDLAGLKFIAGGKPVAWTRDPADMYAFKCEVPVGETALDVELDFLSPTALSGFSSAASATAKLAAISWNQLLLYPQGPASDDLNYVASIRLPAGWKFSTALRVDKQTSQEVTFKPVSLTTLVDSPLICGLNTRSVPLSKEDQPVASIELVSDSAVGLEMSPKLAETYRRLYEEALALFGGWHFREYHFLYTLSDHVGNFGLEHHESSDDRVPERTFADASLHFAHADLLPHEFVHSWNGKYRRPADLATADYHQPMRSELLWVYEGLTQYLGKVLAARSGLLTEDESRETLAWIAAYLDRYTGRKWRPLVDTATAAQLLYGAPRGWAAARRSVDFYDESVLLWLEADTMIRQQTRGKKTLDDFCRRFHGGRSEPMVNPYTFDDVVKKLNEIVPSDWKSFFTSRVYSVTEHPPLAGIANSGWKLVYSGDGNDFIRAIEESRRTLDLSFSIGLILDNGRAREENGTVIDVMPGMPAAQAGISPGMKLVAVNGRHWSEDVLRDALRSAKGTTERLDLLVENGEFLKTYSLDYHDGERFPHLEREASKPDLLEQIFRPLKGKR